MLPISGASCRRAGTAPARSRPRRRADGSVRIVEPAPPGRRRFASGLGTWRKSARSASPDHAARCCHRGCPSQSRWRKDVGRTGLLDHGITAALRRERCGPAVTRPGRAPSGARDFGRDPSIVGVQPSCQRSAPGIRIDSPSSIEPGWVSRFTPLHPLRPGLRMPLRCSLSEWRVRTEPLALLVSP